MIFKVWISRLGIYGVDILFMFAPFAILFTIFATVGVVNAFNLIDGLNGLLAILLFQPLQHYQWFHSRWEI